MNFAFIRNNLLKRLRWPRRSDRELSLGARGERAAARFLRHRRYRILACNYICPVGEIDLICTDRDTLVFVEVKSRADDERIDPEEFIRPGKWRRVERSARYYLMQHNAADRPCRFDLLTIVWPPGGAPRIEHFEDAFQPRRG